MPPTKADPGIIAEVCPQFPPSTPAQSSIPLSCEFASHVAEAGEAEDAVGFNQYMRPARSGN